MRSPSGRYIAFLAVLQYVCIYILKPIIKRNYIQDQHENLLLFSFFSFFFNLKITAARYSDTQWNV